MEANTSGLGWDSHTRNRKGSNQEDITHHKGALPYQKGYIWGEGEFPGSVGDGAGN